MVCMQGQDMGAMKQGYRLAAAQTFVGPFEYSSSTQPFLSTIKSA
jgi:hypothetical protein